MPAIAIAGLAISAYGAASAADAQRKQLHAQQDAAKAAQDSATNGSVDINALDQQARDFALKNAAQGYALNDKYNPGLNQLRADSLAGVNANLNGSAQTQALADRIAAQAGQAPTGISYDSPLLRDAIAKARGDLALGGTLDRDTQNAATRGAFARSGATTGGLGLGRDLQARDLGLTSLQIEQQRLQNAATLGNSEAGLGQGNANLSLQAQLAGTNNLFNSANFLQSLDNGNFARQLNAATLAQNIADPQTGLDPGSVVNLAVGNSNARAQGLQQASALQAAGANQKSQMAGQLVGAGLGLAAKYYQPAPATPTYTAPAASSVPYYGWGMTPTS